MNKEEILKLAQKEKNNEMELQIKDKSMMWTYLAMVLTAAIFSFIKAEQGYPIMDLTATVCVSVCVGHAYRFMKGKDRTSLLIALIMLVTAVMATVRFFMGH